MYRFLNVGGGNKAIPVPSYYDGWEHLLLDIDPRDDPDIVCDARKLMTLPPKQFDAIYCSHNLEHYYRHDIPKVLAGFIHLLKDDGFAHIRVPDIGQVVNKLADDKMDIDDVLYISAAGPITAHDVIYGYGLEIERSGQDFYAHKSGFTDSSLRKTLQLAGFQFVYAGTDSLEIMAFAFVNKPKDFAVKLLGLPKG